MEYQEFCEKTILWLEKDIREPLKAERICMWDEEERLKEGMEVCQRRELGMLFVHLDLEKMYQCCQEEGWKAFQEKGRKFLQEAGLLAPAKRKAQDYKDLLSGKEKELFERLRSLRARIARENAWPAYVVFSNQALFEMAKARPHSFQELQGLKGAGGKNTFHFGKQFLDEISSYEMEVGGAWESEEEEALGSTAGTGPVADVGSPSGIKGSMNLDTAAEAERLADADRTAGVAAAAEAGYPAGAESLIDREKEDAL